ncbi:hypothetical protein Anas_08568 [Armadillidium nasatum]|uniref:WAP domain-containing protein n=1 Tax=Armadillidium nasatum TaxID=96803 RepID=A0A5N5SKG1_9CRUS|nr:hypothetical protein Anas_08568 [Armadillidium nasatum]
MCECPIFNHIPINCPDEAYTKDLENICVASSDCSKGMTCCSDGCVRRCIRSYDGQTVINNEDYDEQDWIL